VKGTKTISLSVTDVNAVTATTSTTVSITPLALVVSIAGPTTGTVGIAVQFTATATGGTGSYTFAWTATGGNPSSGTGSSFTTTYAVAGAYTVTVTVTDANAVTATASQGITINQPGKDITVDFQPTHTIVGVTNFVSNITGGAPSYTCSWNFRDGTPAQPGCNPAHNFTAARSYNVTLSVTDSAGTAGSKTKLVVVDRAPFFSSFKTNNQVDWGAGEDWTVTVTNPSTFTVTVTVTIDVYDGDGGSIAAHLSQTATIAPSGSVTMRFHFATPPVPHVYSFTAKISYSASLGTFMGVPMMVTGVSDVRTGTFDVQDPLGSN
jgi:PKD repeat protein